MRTPVTRYLIAWLGASATALLCVALFNLVVDPYGFYDLVRVQGFNAIKPQATSHSHIVKPYLIDRVRPHAMLLGDSRIEVGFDPESDAWPRDALPVLNLGLPGTGPAAHLQFVRYAVRGQQLKYVLVGLHFNDFLSRKGSAAPQPETSKSGYRGLRVNDDGSRNSDYWLLKLADINSTLFSLDTLTHSALTLAAQREKYPADMTPLGFNPMRNYLGEAETAGYYYLFRTWHVAHVRPTAMLKAWENSSDFDPLREIIDVCRAHGVNLQLVIYPYHAQLLELTRAAGLWEPFEQWKRELVRIVDEESRKQQSGPAPHLWDFSGYNSVTTDAVPPRGNTSIAMRWYWEAGHFKKEVGNLVLERIFRPEIAARQVPSDFGVELTPRNIEAHLAVIRSGQAAYRAANAASIAEIEDLLAPHLLNDGARP